MGTHPMKTGRGPRPDRIPEKKFPCRVSSDDDQIRVSVDLLGISEEKIRIDLDETLVISATHGERRLQTSIELP